MEGSFGTQKEHYAMRRIKARMKETEILFILCEYSVVGRKVDGTATGRDRIVELLKQFRSGVFAQDSGMKVGKQREIRAMKPGPGDKIV